MRFHQEVWNILFNRRWLFAFVAALVAAYIAFRHFAVAYVLFSWMHHLGLPILFWRPVTAALWTGLAGAAAFAAVTYINLSLTLPAIASPAAVPGINPQAGVLPLTLQALRRTNARRIVLAVALAVGALAGWVVSSQWPTVWFARDAAPFPTTDPLFHRNIAFFMFTLPLWHLLLTTAGIALWLSALAAGIIYFATGWLNFIDGRLAIHPRPRAHLGALIAIYLLVKAAGYQVDRWNLDYSTNGFVFGAGWADVHVRLPVLWLLSGLALLAAFAAAVYARGGSARLLAWSLGGLVTSSVLLGAVLPRIMESIVVKPSQYSMEKPYILNNIAMTRLGFGLNHIKLLPFPVHTNLNATDLKSFRSTFRNIRLWDGTIAEPAFQQLQGLRTYYSFDPMHIDRYTVNGEYRQVLLAPREINYNALPAQTWVNRHITYTHGYGVVVIPSSQIASRGQPQFWVKNIPTTSSVGLKVTQPSIYYGQQTSLYALVDGRRPAFDYPKGSKDVYSNYKGTGGIPIGSFFNRLAFSMWANSYNPLLTNDVTPTTRAMIYRSLSQRLPRLIGAPFLYYGTHPYIVIAHGHLDWIVNGYTESANFPYSTPSSNGANYLRNSVKVVISAYNGTVRYYAVDPRDPMLQTIERIFPGVIHPERQMPATLRQHLRYPSDLFSIQANVYATYHMTDPLVFYNNEDKWRVANQIIGQHQMKVQPYYVIMRFPNISKPQFVLMQPFTPVGANRDNMVAWMAAFSDGKRYGQVQAYEFPKSQTVYGPLQIEAQINQDKTVSDILALWSRGGSRVYRGNMLTIPVRDSFLYVEPLYQEATATNLPALRRVIVDYNGQQIAVGSSLDQALAQIFGKLPWSSLNAGALSGVTRPSQSSVIPRGSASSITSTQTSAIPPTTAKTLSQLNQLYRAAQTALRQGHFSTYGKDIDALGRLLRKALPKGASATSPTSTTAKSSLATTTATAIKAPAPGSNPAQVIRKATAKVAG